MPPASSMTSSDCGRVPSRAVRSTRIQRNKVGSVPVSPRPRRSRFWRGARHEERSLVIPNERRITLHCAKTGPALRVARQMAPCVVAGLAKGMTIACVPRLAWRDLAQQRGSRTKREQTLTGGDDEDHAVPGTRTRRGWLYPLPGQRARGVESVPYTPLTPPTAYPV